VKKQVNREFPQWRAGSDAEDPGLEQAGCIKRVREGTERCGLSADRVDETRSAESRRHPRPIAHKTSIFPSKIRNITWRQG